MKAGSLKSDSLINLLRKEKYMTLIKCLECGGMVSSTCESCPHCGCKIDSTINTTVVQNDKPTVVVLKRNCSVPTTLPLIEIIIGILLSVAIIGLAFLLVGIWTAVMINKNNAQSKEILYFNRENNEFIGYDIKGKKYNISIQSARSNIKVQQGANGYTGVIYNKKVQLGWIETSESRKLRDFLDQLN